MRGVAYLGGAHSLKIDAGGVRVYPRQETLAPAPRYRATNQRVSMGVGGLDEMMRGGPIRSSSAVVAGPAGAGKTVLSLHFLAAPARRGERGLMVSFQENPEQLALRAGQFGLGKALDIAGRRTEVLFLSPFELDLDEAAARIREAVEARNVQRVVIDSVAELELAASGPERFGDFLASLVGFLRGHEVTTLLTREITPIFGGELAIASRGLPYIDNIVLLRYIEFAAGIRRAIVVLKMRGSDHDTALHELLFADGQATVGGRFEKLSGSLGDMALLAKPFDIG
jgi:circadian clock protein KaiC